MSSDSTKGRNKTVQRTSNSSNALSLNKPMNNFQNQKLSGGNNDSGACNLPTRLDMKSELSRKTSLGGGVRSGMSVSTVADGEWSTERLQDVNSDPITEVGTFGSNEEFQTKKEAPHTFFVKLLVSNQLAGMLIGTSGQEIKALKEKTGAKVVLSPHGKYFPGTAERLVVLEGAQQKVFSAIEWIVNKVVEIAATDPGGMNKPAFRICVPRAVVGSLIGKNGSYIQFVRVTTGAHVHVSPLFVSADEACAERVVTIQSRDRDSLRMAAFTVLKKINEHPSNMTCRNISYLKKSDFSIDCNASDASSLSSGSNGLTQSHMNYCAGNNNLFSSDATENVQTTNLSSTGSYLQAYSSHSTTDHANTQNVTGTSTLFHPTLPSSVIPVVLGPPPGLGGCKPHVSATVARNTWDAVYQGNSTTDGETPVRYNREVSAETESTQCSLNMNHRAAISSTNNTLKSSLFTKGSTEPLTSVNHDILLGNILVEENPSGQQGIGKDCSDNVELVTPSGETVNNMGDGTETDAYQSQTNDNDAHGTWVSDWLRDCKTIQLDRIIQGWGITIAIAFLYYLITTWVIGAEK